MAIAFLSFEDPHEKLIRERDDAVKRVNSLMELLADAQKERDSALARVDELEYLLRVKEGALNLAEMQRDNAFAQARNLKRDLETCLTVQERLNEHNTALRQLVRDYRTWLRDADTLQNAVQHDGWMAMYEELETEARKVLREEIPK